MKRRRRRERLTCSEVLDYVCDDIEVSKDSPVCRKIRTHLSECPNCSAYLQSLRKTIRLYTAYKVRTPADLHSRVMASLKRGVLVG